MNERIIIVNADDFGLTEGVNSGVAEAFERGIVTSTTLMVRKAAAAQAAVYARDHPELSVGLHFDLGEWEFLDGTWVSHYEVVDTTDPDAVAAEVGQQLEMFKDLVGRNPTHIDSHQHVHRDEVVSRIARRTARALGVSLRHFDKRITYCGEFYGQTGRGEPLHEAITTVRFAEIISQLGAGWTELACHPGHPDDPDGDRLGSYRQERGTELAVLCNPMTRRCLAEAGVRLASFAEFPGALR